MSYVLRNEKTRIKFVFGLNKAPQNVYKIRREIIKTAKVSDRRFLVLVYLEYINGIGSDMQKQHSISENK